MILLIDVPNPMGKKLFIRVLVLHWYCFVNMRFLSFFQDSKVSQLFIILPDVPADICLMFIVVRFAVLLFPRLRRRWLQSAVSRRCSSELKTQDSLLFS